MSPVSPLTCLPCLCPSSDWLSLYTSWSIHWYFYLIFKTKIIVPYSTKCRWSRFMGDISMFHNLTNVLPTILFLKVSLLDQRMRSTAANIIKTAQHMTDAIAPVDMWAPRGIPEMSVSDDWGHFCIILMFYWPRFWKSTWTWQGLLFPTLFFTKQKNVPIWSFCNSNSTRIGSIKRYFLNGWYWLKFRLIFGWSYQN